MRRRQSMRRWNVIVGGSDIIGIRLTAVKPSNGAGRVVFADPGAAQSLRPGTLRLMPAPALDRRIVFGGYEPGKCRMKTGRFS